MLSRILTHSKSFPVLRNYCRSLSYDFTDHLKVNWNSDHSSVFEYSWLRDNCKCEQCVEPSSGQKIFDRSVLSNSVPNTIKQYDESFHIEWKDGHETTLSSDFLKRNCNSNLSRKERAKNQQPLLWTKDTLHHIPSVNYENVINNDSSVLEWLNNLQTEGICMIKECGKDENVVKSLANRIGPIRSTTYGDTWRVETVPKAENIAYTSVKLGLHTDILYYETCPGIQFLHCITQAKEGAENIFADAFKVAEDFRELYPSHFDILCKVKITYLKEHSDTYRKYRRPLFIVDEDNELVSVNFSPQFEGPLETLPENVKPFYEAYVNWHKFLSNPKYIIEHKLEEGDTVVFNNRRILHGRNGFSQQERRLLMGTYVDLDDVANRIAVLQRNMNIPRLIKKLGNYGH